MRVVLIGLLLSVPSLASAQADLSLPSAEVLTLEASALREGENLRDTGASLTLGGILETGFGLGLMFAYPLSWATLIPGACLVGLGSLGGLIGIPMWIVGAVRSDILSRPPEERAAIGWTYQLAGMTTTLVGIALVVLGGATMGGSFAIDDADVRQRVTATGGIAIPVGYFLATFIGPAMWSEGARF